jgi:hypothetical protein
MSCKKVVITEFVPKRMMAIEVASPDISQWLYRSCCGLWAPQIGTYGVQHLIVVTVVVHIDYLDGSEGRPEDLDGGYIG